MMLVLLYLTSFIGMELVAWFTHKFIMHGFLWKWHQDHHVPNPKAHLQKNDYFFLIFATPGILCIIGGPYFELAYLPPIGWGITSYGLAYFIIHDVFIHRRLKWFRNTKNKYLKAISRAHKVHHKKIHKTGGECFGMLWVAFKYYV